MKFSGCLAKCVGLICCAALAGCVGPGLTPPRSQSTPTGNFSGAGRGGSAEIGVTTPPAAGGAPVVGVAGTTGSAAQGSAGSSGPTSADAGELDAGSEDDGGPASQRR